MLISIEAHSITDIDKKNQIFFFRCYTHLDSLARTEQGNTFKSNYLPYFDSTFVISDANLHRPEGVVFAPDGTLWVTSFRPFGPNGMPISPETDRLMAFNISDGSKADEIALWNGAAGDTRSYAQVVLFGPAGNLFAPISNTGELRSYDVSTHAYTTITQPGAPLKGPQYLTFDGTNPSTLDYGN